LLLRDLIDQVSLGNGCDGCSAATRRPMLLVTAGLR
jgi:hypothetical protein